MQTLSFKILFDSPDFVAVDKPSNTLSVPSRLGEEDKRFCVGTKLQKELKFQIYPIHRLDFEVSGVLLFAKNKLTHQLANSWFEEGSVIKTYEALSLENPQFSIGQNFEWKSKILKGKKRAYEHDLGKDSLTLAKIFQEINLDGRKILKWNLIPKTGRSHQIRFEMYKHECPILGDKLYGSNIQINHGIALRAVCLDFSLCKTQDLKISQKITTNGFSDNEIQFS